MHTLNELEVERIKNFTNKICFSREQLLSFYQYIDIFLKLINNLDIPYFAFSNTALAVELCHGFIPWHKTFDIMIEEDYEQLLIDNNAIFKKYGIYLHENSKDGFYQFYLKNDKIKPSLTTYFPINVFVGIRNEQKDRIIIHYKRSDHRTWHPNRFFYIEEVYPLNLKKFGPLSISTIASPKFFLERSGLSLHVTTIQVQNVDKQWLDDELNFLRQLNLYPIENFSIFPDYAIVPEEILSLDNYINLPQLPQFENLPPGKFLCITSPQQITREMVLSKIQEAQEFNWPVFVFLPFIDWNIAFFQRPQHIARAMAKVGALVIYFSSQYLDTSDGYFQLEDNLIWSNKFNEFASELTGVWLDFYSTNCNINLDLINKIKTNNYILYEYVDHIDEKISGNCVPHMLNIFNNLNKDLIDVFLGTANDLYWELMTKFQSQRRTILVPNGVDVYHFTTRHPPNERMRAILKNKKPIIGYWGALAQWLDYKLIIDVVALRPDLNFVFIGSKYANDINLPVADNLFWLGHVNYNDLPSYGQYFDVCFILFEDGRIAETTSPLKLFEYFALRKPVVVTSWMTECIAFNEVFHGKNSTEISQAIDMAIYIAKSLPYQDKLFQLAKENSWLNRAECIIKAITTNTKSS